MPHAGPYLSDVNGAGSEFGREMSDMQLSPRLETQWEEERAEGRGREGGREGGRADLICDRFGVSGETKVGEGPAN